jgi:hypothetical protein
MFCAFVVIVFTYHERRNMFREATREALKRQRQTYQWLANETGIPRASIASFLSNTSRSLSTGRIERIFEALGITVVVPED